mgnify:CR=1 FL=1
MAQALPFTVQNAGMLFFLVSRPLRNENEIRKPDHGEKGLSNA